MAKDRVVIHLACGDCGERNYSQRVSKKKAPGKRELKKYCSKCRKHCSHKETK